MGGVRELVTLLSEYKQSGVVSLLCEVLGAVSQNNPRCQDEMLELAVLKTLMDIATDEANTWTVTVRVKAFYAVSCEWKGCL